MFYERQVVGLFMASTGVTVLHFCLLMADLRSGDTDFFNVINVFFVAGGIGFAVWAWFTQGIEIETDKENDNG